MSEKFPRCHHSVSPTYSLNTTDPRRKEKGKKLCPDLGKKGDDDSALYFPRFRKREIKAKKRKISRKSDGCLCHVILISSIYQFPGGDRQRLAVPLPRLPERRIRLPHPLRHPPHLRRQADVLHGDGHGPVRQVYGNAITLTTCTSGFFKIIL